jgi:MFS family permease
LHPPATTTATTTAAMTDESDNATEVADLAAADPAQQQQPKGIAFVLLMVSIYLSMFLVALDQLIISTAIPRITDEFQSIGDIGWYGSAYLLTSCSFQLMFGKMYTFFPVRLVYLTAILLFEVGSAICGAAPTSAVLIGGRVVQGVGAAGMFSGAVSSFLLSSF